MFWGYWWVLGWVWCRYFWFYVVDCGDWFIWCWWLVFFCVYIYWQIYVVGEFGLVGVIVIDLYVIVFIIGYGCVIGQCYCCVVVILIDY